jgi:hypothetical protein
MPRFMPTKIVLRSQGEQYILRGANLQALENLEDLDSNLPDRDYAVRFLHGQLVSPEISLEKLSSLPNRTLGRILRLWSAHEGGFNTPLPTKGSVFAAFRQVSQKYLTEELARLATVLSSIPTLSPN